MVTLKEMTAAMEPALLGQVVDFWHVHGAECSPDEVLQNIRDWQGEGHALYAIMDAEQPVGFLHLGSRGAGRDWIEEIYVQPERRGKGLASEAIRLVEGMIREGGSDAAYIEVAANNAEAIGLYHKLGYDRLALVVLRKDFVPVEDVGEVVAHGKAFKVAKGN